MLGGRNYSRTCVVALLLLLLLMRYYVEPYSYSNVRQCVSYAKFQDSFVRSRTTILYILMLKLYTGQKQNLILDSNTITMAGSATLLLLVMLLLCRTQY